MKDKVQRIGKMFNSKTKKSVMIPMDHGILGIPPGLEDPVKSFKGFVELGADAILLNIGILKLVREYLNSLKKVPGIILAIDYNLRWPKWKIPIETDCIIAHCIKHDIELALKYGADAIKIYFALGLEPRLQFNYIKNICKIVNECDKYNMPVMIEPVTEEKYISQNKKGDPEIIVNELKKLIKDIRNMAKNMGFKVRSFEDAWTPLKEGIIKFVESLDEKSDLIFVLRTTKRLVKGETLEFNLKAVDNKVLYIKGDILEGEVDGSLSRQKIKQQVETIYKEISEISKKNGMIVDPMSNLDNLALYDLTNEIKRRNRKLVLEFVIDADVYLNGPFIYSLNLKAI